MKPVIICFMGLDGSGKSTSIEYAYRLLKERGVNVEIVRAAYVIKYMTLPIKIGKRLLLKKNNNPFSGDYRTYLEKMRRSASHGFVFSVFTFLTTIEFKLQIFLNIRWKRFRGKTLLVDRYIYDNAVTYAANLDLGEEFMIKILNTRWKNVPKPDRLIYIKTPIEICCTRKDDIPDPLYLEIREPRYDKIASLYNAAIISGAQEKSAMLDEVMEVVNSCLSQSKQ